MCFCCTYLWTCVCTWVYFLTCSLLYAWIFELVCVSCMSMNARLCMCVHTGECHLRHPFLRVPGFLSFRFVRTLAHSLHVCLWDQWRVMMFRMLLLAASLPTVKVISLFSPLPAAATRDRLTNTNHLDGQSKREKDEGKKERGTVWTGENY